MTLTLLHTADAHVATFDRLRDTLAPGLALRHVVRPDWLEDARRAGIGPALDTALAELIGTAGGTVICTCTTLGPAAERHGAIRVDRPMMQAAGRIGGRIVMAYALDSTRQPSLDLLTACLDGRSEARPLDLTAFWPAFEAGETARFHSLIAGAVRAELADRGGDCVVLAQASMAGAADLLGDLPCPVLTSPALALRAGTGPV